MRYHTVVLFVIIVLLAYWSEPLAGERTHLRWMHSKPSIDSVVIEGNKSFSDGRIRKQLYSRRDNLWRALRGDRRRKVQRETLQRDTLELTYLYFSHGFLGAKVRERFEPIGPDSTALVRVHISEGRQFLYGEPIVTGEAREDLLFHCRKIARRFKNGKPINLFAVRQAVFEMKTHLANNGFPYAQVLFDIDTSRGGALAPITFVLRPDSLVHFGNVKIEGTHAYPESAARRELRIKPGAIYRRDDILGSQRRLFESGYFSTFSLKKDPQALDRLNPDFVLRVRERKARYIDFRTGAGQSEVRDLIWDVSGGFGKRNFLGSRRYEVLTDYSFSLGTDSRLITHRYRLRYTEPWLFNIRMPLSLTFEVNPRVKDPVNDFDKASWSISAITRRGFGDKVRTALGIEYQYVKISGVPEDQVTLLKQLTNNTARRKIFATFLRDTRDNLFVPRKGVVIDLSAEVYGGFLGGDEHFYKLQASWSRYEAVWPGWISATRLRGSWAEAFGKSREVPLDEAIYLGGANTVRSFNENELGRFFEGETPVVPRYTLVFNQEFRWRTLQVLSVIPVLNDLMRTFPLWQSVFFDAGNGFRTRHQIRLDSFAYSYGAGFQIITPAGPVRIDYARRIRTERFDFAERWHFTILYSF